MLIAARQSFLTNAKPYDAEIEYLESTGTQYIDIGVIGDMSLDFDIYFMPTELQNVASRGNGSIFGSRREFNSRAYQLTTYNKSNFATQGKGHFLCGLNYSFGSSQTPTAAMFLNGVNHISKQGLVFTRADGTTFNMTSQTFTTPNSIVLFGLHAASGGVGEYSKSRIYSLKFSSNSTLLRDFIPVRVENTGCMYDKLGIGGMNSDGTARNDGLYFGRGTGSFILGPDK